MSYAIHLLSEAESPVTHMRGVEGNEALVAREWVDTPAGKRFVPYLSGNALRHRLVREPGALWLIDRLGLKGQLSLMQLNFLLHGGNLTDSTGREDTARIADMQELFPLLRLLGGALPDQILTGSLLAWRGQLVCEENRRFLSLPPGYELPAGPLKPAEHYVEAYQYTRGAGDKRADWYDAATRDPDAKSNLMIFSGQCVIKGSCFLHGFDIPRGSEVELGCLLHAVGLWQADGGSVGGQAGKGHGRLRTVVVGGDRRAYEAAVTAYVAHVDAHADRCRGWLEAVFGKAKQRAEKRAAEKPAKNGKGKTADLTGEADG